MSIKNSSGSTSAFAPFRSGCGICRPSTDYYKQQLGGKGNYSNDGLIPQLNGKNFYHEKNFREPLNNKFMDKNYGIDYATSFGGKKSKNSSYKGEDKNESKTLLSNKGLKKNKMSMKGGQESSGATALPQRFFNPTMPIDNSSCKSGDGIMSAYGEIKSGDIGTGMLAPYTSSKSLTANHNTFMKTGGKKEAKASKVKEIKVKEVKVKEVKAKKTKKIMKGGQESSGATALPQRFFNPTMPIDNSACKSGNGIMSAYGQIKSGDIGTGMLAPYTSSQSLTANHNTFMKTGGKKEVKVSKVKDSKVKDSKVKETKVKDAKVKETKVKDAKVKDAKVKDTKVKETKKKIMKGGQESSGATSLPQRFFNPTMPIDNSACKSGDGIMSAYGQIKSGDIGTGMLAPYTSSKSLTANHNTFMKTGGKKNKKGGADHIPQIDSKSVDTVQGTVVKAIDKFTGFMKKLDDDYLKSVDYVKSIKVGNQRLIQGGKKNSKKGGKKDSKKNSKKGGSNGSDFALTLNSRGPVNAPDHYWGVDGKTWFRQFNKTGEYIPNSQLANAATPLLAGKENNIFNKSSCDSSINSSPVKGFDPMDLNYPSF